MFVSIDDIFLFSARLWSEIETITFTEAESYTWQDLSNYQQNGSILVDPRPAIHNVVEDRSTSEFTVRDIGANYHFERGQEVICYSSDDFSVIFGGYIDSVTEKIVSSYNVLYHDIKCTDYHYLSDKRIVAKAWVDTTIDTAVDWILTEILADEGVTEGNIQTAGTLTQYTADYISASECLDKLAEMAGFTWWINEEKKLYFVERGTYDADWDLLETAAYVITDAEHGSLTVTHGNPEYRNKQYLKGGKAKTDVQTEYFIGDGAQQTFVVGYDIDDEPLVYISTSGGEYVQKTVGIKGVETDHDFYWSKNDNSITQELQDTALTNSQTLKITYIGVYPIIAVSANFGEISDRQETEGSTSSGKVEMVSSDSNVTSMESALEKVNAILAHYAAMGKKIEYSTTKPGLAAGTLQHIKLSKHDVDDDCLIGSIDVEFDSVYDHYQVSAYTGPVEDSWTKLFFKAYQLQKAAESAQSTSDVVLILQTFYKTWTSSETPNIWKKIYPDGSVLPGNQWFPCFNTEDRIKYLALYYDGEEVYRTYRATQTILDTQMVTTFFIPSQSANMSFDYAKLVGGDNATEVVESGTIVETHNFVYVKNSLESLQMQFTSNKYPAGLYSYRTYNFGNRDVVFTSEIGSGPSITVTTPTPNIDDMVIGNIDHAGTGYSSTTISKTEFTKCIASKDGNVNTVRVWPASTGQTIVGIYSDSGGLPGTLLSESAITNVISHEWINISVPEIAATNGTTYWIACCGNGLIHRYRTYSMTEPWFYAAYSLDSWATVQALGHFPAVLDHLGAYPPGNPPGFVCAGINFVSPPITITVVDDDITYENEVDCNGNSVTTAQELMTANNADPSASTIISISLPEDSDGSGIFGDLEQVYLTEE
jgi:hypothetical protein